MRKIWIFLGVLVTVAIVGLLFLGIAHRKNIRVGFLWFPVPLHGSEIAQQLLMHRTSSMKDHPLNVSTRWEVHIDGTLSRYFSPLSDGQPYQIVYEEMTSLPTFLIFSGYHAIVINLDVSHDIEYRKDILEDFLNTVEPRPTELHPIIAAYATLPPPASPLLSFLLESDLSSKLHASIMYHPLSFLSFHQHRHHHPHLHQLFHSTTQKIKPLLGPGSLTVGILTP